MDEGGGRHNNGKKKANINGVTRARWRATIWEGDVQAQNNRKKRENINGSERKGISHQSEHGEFPEG